MVPDDTNSFSVSAPQPTLPKGGGSIRGVGEKFAATPATGTATMSVPIAASPGRHSFGPQLALGYDSSAGNGPFGFGWHLALPAITRKTDSGLPQYQDAQDAQDAADSDVFLLSGSDDLVPVLLKDLSGQWVPEVLPLRTVGAATYRIRRYRPRIEGLFARIERWTNVADETDVFWRSISSGNLTSWYGLSAESRIADPSDPRRIFSWLICQSHDDRGNVLAYGFKPEDSDEIFADGTGGMLARNHERNRSVAARSAQRYLKRIRYGNKTPYFPVLQSGQPWPAPVGANAVDGSGAWHFELVFDYGEHDADTPTPQAVVPWPARPDPFSTYRAGFEVRTYRSCHRALMFHHFDQEPGLGADTLVQSTEFTYSSDLQPTSPRLPIYTFLKAVTQSGYRREGAGYARSSLPPTEFDYTEPVVQDRVETVDPESLAQLPIGLDGSTYRWADLHGEGLAGILTEQAGAWYYKRNLGPLTNTAQFAPAQRVASQPNASLTSGAELMDLAGDGQPDVVVLDRVPAGFYEHDEGQGWQPFRAFVSRLNRDLRDPNTRLIDLDGDGQPDVLVTEEDALVWHRSLGEEGFGAARTVPLALDEERGPRVVFADGAESLFTADLCGDGLTDLVRIRNGEVCYWPNLGHGRFGAKVTMERAPLFDHPDQFDPARLRLADIDGSGTTDIIYLHREGVRLYFNQCGNAWSEPQVLKVFPPVDNLARMLPLDLLGNGTACLVWSSALPGDARHPMRYVNLMGGRKPHLLVRSTNNLGGETRVDYAPSTKFYLQDLQEGRPWVTRLPFPVHVVERVETYDHIGRSRLVTRYAYHHGYFDGAEREFRGFGMVEQWDAENFDVLAADGVPASNEDLATHVPPVHTKTWFHTGVYLGRDAVSDYFAGLLDGVDAGEYFREPGQSDAQARAALLADTVLPAGLSLDEEREACRALKGAMLRQEIYADDAGHDGATPQQLARARTPYLVQEQNLGLRVLQRRGSNPHAVFLRHPSEALSRHYERDATNARTQHVLTLDVDDHGNVLKSVALGYGRAASLLPTPWDRDRQTAVLMTYTEQRVTNAVSTADAHRSPQPCEDSIFELTGYDAARPDGRFQATDFVEPDAPPPGALRLRFNPPEVPFEATASGARRRRQIERRRTLFRRDDLAGLLPLGQMQSLALAGEGYKLAFTPGLLQQTFQRPQPALPAPPAELLLPNPADVLAGPGGDRGGYVASQSLKADGRFPAADPDDHWWLRSGRSFHSTGAADSATVELAQARQHFFSPRRCVDPFDQPSVVDFDAYDLLLTEVRDPLGNRVTVDRNDYRVLQPSLVSDPNRNQTEVAFDVLGLVVGSAVMGKPAPAPQEGDSLAGFVADLSLAQQESFFTALDPRAVAAPLLAGATTRTVYDLHRFYRSRQAHPNDPGQWLPICVASLARETHLHAALPPQGLQLQMNFSYRDGAGRSIQEKSPTAPGPLDLSDPMSPVQSPRWVGSGWAILNNKGLPVRRYEPFFSSTHGFEFAAVHGVSTVLFHDPLGRLIATLNPDHTYEKVVFDAWRHTAYDVNDTCAARGTQTGDPRTDPDIQGYVKAWFDAQPGPWLTWRAQRINGALGPDEQRAAQRAEAHADTPNTAHVDALGRVFLNEVVNRVVCPGHALDGTEERLAMRTELDVEGQQLSVRDAIVQAGDPLGRVVSHQTYDMLGRRLRQVSMDAGTRWTLADTAGQPLRAWDSRGHNFSYAFDALRRPTTQHVRGTTAESDPRTLNLDVMVERIEYGEALPNAEALNLRSRAYRHFDGAGVQTLALLDAAGDPTLACDFKGNQLGTTRRLVRDYTLLVDWSVPPDVDDERFESSFRYDALNRPVQRLAPRSNLGRGAFNVIQPRFNEANQLHAIDVWLERPAAPAGLLDPALDAPSLVGVDDIGYDAKGQRLHIVYRNGTSSSYTHDPLTFRLTRLTTERVPAGFPGDDPQPPLPGWPGRLLQNLGYVYDPAGNVTHIEDAAQQRVFFNNQRIDPANDYVYDALYRLIQATGREHLGQSGQPVAHAAQDTGRVQQPQPNSGNLMARYCEKFVYDAAANLQALSHHRSCADAPGWSRQYDYLEPSLIEDGLGGTALKTSNRLSRTTLAPGGASPQVEPCHYDAHGNLRRISHLGGGAADPNLHWDAQDQLWRADLGGGGTAFHVYDAAGQRVRKVWEKAPGLVEERLYLGGFEIFRRHAGPIAAGSLRLERETLHVMDDQQRIALVETRTLDTAGNDPVARRLISYQINNHLGSSSLVLDEQAAIVSYEEYAPYGSTTYQAVRSQTELAKRYRFTGKERDEETGFYYHGARYYIPWLAVWASCDPVWTPSPYVYAKRNPVRLHDPDGRDDEPSIWEQIRQSDTGQFIGGVLAGTSSSFVPGGFLLAPVGEGTGVLNKPSRAFQAGFGAGEFATGVTQVIGGAGGEIGGVALDLTGVGAVVGVPVNIVSAAVIVQGSGNTVMGLGNFIEAVRRDPAPVPTRTTPKSEPAPKAAEKPVDPAPKAEAPQKAAPQKPADTPAPQPKPAAKPTKAPAAKQTPQQRAASNQAKQDKLVKNQQKELKDAIDRGGAKEKGRVLDAQGTQSEKLTNDTLKQVEGAEVRTDVSLGKGEGSVVDNVVSKGGKRVFVENKLTIASIETRTVNQINNALKASAPGDSVILQVARAPTAAELTALEKALGPEAFSKIKVVSSQTDLLQAVTAALK